MHGSPWDGVIFYYQVPFVHLKVSCRVLQTQFFAAVILAVYNMKIEINHEGENLIYSFVKPKIIKYFGKKNSSKRNSVIKKFI